MNGMKHITGNDIKSFDRFYRGNFINSLSGTKPAFLIGTKSESGNSNLALFTSVVHIGADPPLIGFIQRPVGEFSHTYKNIKLTGFYTLNHIHQEFAEKAHRTSAKFPENISEFNECGLSEEYLNDFYAPFVAESRIRMAVEFNTELPIEINGTKLIIGMIKDVYLQQDLLEENGEINLAAASDVAVSNLSTYNSITRLNSFPYAGRDSISNSDKPSR